VDLTEIQAALNELDPADRDAVRDWLRDAADDADQDDPSVGIYANPRMSHFFRTVGCLVEQVSA
jgi:hypothetical protein